MYLLLLLYIYYTSVISMKSQKLASLLSMPSRQTLEEESHILWVSLSPQMTMVSFGPPCFPLHLHLSQFCSHTVPPVATPKTWNSAGIALGFHRETKGHQRLLVSTCFSILPSMARDPCRACNPIPGPKSFLRGSIFFVEYGTK